MFPIWPLGISDIRQIVRIELKAHRPAEPKGGLTVKLNVCTSILRSEREKDGFGFYLPDSQVRTSGHFYTVMWPKCRHDILNLGVKALTTYSYMFTAETLVTTLGT